MPSDLPPLCVVVPCYNEQESLPALVDNLTPALEQATGGSWRVLFVDDGSTDDTPRFIWELNARDPRFGGVRLSRNFGHQPAVATALRFASGQSVGIIDCDLQDPPEVLIELFTKVRDGQCDVCSGQRAERDEVPGWLQFCYKGFYRLMAAMAEHPFMLDAGDFCVFNRRVHLALLSLPEIMQVQRGLRSWVGFRQASLSYRRPPRHGGSSKYNFSRLVRLALDNVVNFTTLPLRLASWLGFFMIILIGLAMAFFLVNRFVPSFAPFGYRVGENPGTTTLVMYFSIITAAIFVCLGILGEYVAVLIREVKRRPTALVAEVTPGVSRLPEPPGTAESWCAA
jgi:polyisoprenyl-phosphate glycosyltransferase